MKNYVTSFTSMSLIVLSYKTF